jgi:hypothetical protein
VWRTTLAISSHGYPADGVAGQVDGRNAGSAPRTAFEVGSSLHDPEEGLIARACVRGLASFEPPDCAFVGDTEPLLVVVAAGSGVAGHRPAETRVGGALG